MLILFGILFFFTASVGTLFKTNKATATIGLVDTYLSNNSALIINAFIILAPSFITSEQVSNEIVYQAGFISISLKTILTLAVATYFLIIVMAVKFLIDILIFLSPIPFIDAVLEIIKIAAACVFVLISIISPITSVIIAGIMFITSIFFYKRSVRLITKIKYLIVHPILNIFRNKQVKLTDGKNLSILVLTGSKVGGLSEGKIVRLQQDNDEFKLIHKRFFRADLTVKIDFADFTFTQNHLDLKLVNHNDSISLVLNRTYHKYLEELSDSLGAEIKEKKEFNLNLHTSILNRIKNFFRKSDIAELKSITSL